MSRTRKTLVIITGTILLLIVLFFIVLATFDWNRLKPTINQKVSAELNRPFAIRGDLGVVWERQPDERGWRSWIPWPHVHAEDIVLGNPPAIPGDHDPSAAGGGDPCPLALLSKTVYLPWIKLEQPDVRLIRRRKTTITGPFSWQAISVLRATARPPDGPFASIIFSLIAGLSPLTTRSPAAISPSSSIPRQTAAVQRSDRHKR